MESGDPAALLWLATGISAASFFIPRFLLETNSEVPRTMGHLKRVKVGGFKPC